MESVSIDLLLIIVEPLNLSFKILRVALPSGIGLARKPPFFSLTVETDVAECVSAIVTTSNKSQIEKESKKKS